MLMIMMLVIIMLMFITTTTSTTTTTGESHYGHNNYISNWKDLVDHINKKVNVVGGTSVDILVSAV